MKTIMFLHGTFWLFACNQLLRVNPQYVISKTGHVKSFVNNVFLINFISLKTYALPLSNVAFCHVHRRVSIFTNQFYRASNLKKKYFMCEKYLERQEILPFYLVTPLKEITFKPEIFTVTCNSDS